jgi:stage V sporulation protein AC
LDHKSEGFVLGVGGNMFKIAGPVIVFGVFSAFVVAIVNIIFKSLGGI